jgi:SAM-dependent methyltransferase
MNPDPAAKWDARYRERSGTPLPARVLVDNLHLLPKGGDALDLACGLGANALLLCSRGLRTRAWDISAVAIGALRAAAPAGCGLIAEVRDVVRQPPAPDSLDVIVVAHFLERGLFPSLIAALRPGGLLFYQTFTRAAVDPQPGPGNPDFRLDDNELLALCAPLRLLVYREEGLVGDRSRGWRNEAMVVACKPLPAAVVWPQAGRV